MVVYSELTVSSICIYIDTPDSESARRKRLPLTEVSLTPEYEY